MQICLLIVTLALVTDAFAQDEERFTFLPGALAVPPLTAHHQEPRVGLRKEIGTSKMKVDIGASIDLLEVRPSADSLKRIRLGVDFFTYALSTSADGFRLQIDAVDGIFGGHVAYVSDLGTDERLIVRLRLLHLSAHFLDGHYNTATRTWKNNREPIPFTRDFGELLAIYKRDLPDFTYQLHGGFSHATHLRPVEIGRTEFLAGFETHSSSLVGSVFAKPFNLYAAYHLTLRKLTSFVGSNNVDVGVKFGEWNSTGMRIYLGYFNGLDFFSQYYNERREHWALGFAFDFW
jgi:hypothetical protein